jgi:methylthioribulose-1-phosphate dehydratase
MPLVPAPDSRQHTVPTPLAQALTAAMADIHRRGWCDGTGGNFSCVQHRDPLVLLMAPSGVHKGRVQPESLIEVNAAGRVIAGAGKASAETALHLTIVNTCGAGAVLHTHSQAGTLLSRWALRATAAALPPSVPATARREADAVVAANDQSGVDQPGQLELSDLEMLKGLQGISTHATTVRLPVLANDQNLEQLSTRARPWLKAAPHGLLIAGHGLYAWGDDLAMAERHLEILEFLLEQRWRQLLLDALIGTQGTGNRFGTTGVSDAA